MTSSKQQDNYTPPLLPSSEAGISTWSAKNEHRPFRNESWPRISKVTIQTEPQILRWSGKGAAGGTNTMTRA